MPHFDDFGGDEWLCQAPNHSGYRVQNSRVKSEWRPDITGHEGAGNTCPPCVRAFDAVKAHVKEFVASGGLAPGELGAAIPGLPSRRDRVNPATFINPLDFADDPAELELQLELQRLGISNEPRPETCPLIRESTGAVCGSALRSASGFAGETVLVCDVEGHSIVWEDNEGAIRNVF